MKSQPDNSFMIMERVRSGEIDAETAIDMIDELERRPFWERVFLALLDTFFSRSCSRRDF
jgi:hypothetical protein